MNDTHSCDPKARREFRRSVDGASRFGEFRIGVTVAIGLTAALLASLAGCHAPSPRATSPDRAPPAQSPALADPSYDWHGLLIAPFGSVLKEVPLTLHEVLLFRDEAHGANAADEAECYAGDTPPPRFVGRTPDEYLLCFKQDRLSRVQASVRLTAAEAPEVFAAACARWSKQATPATASPGAVGAGAASDAAQGAAIQGAAIQDAAIQGAAGCEGHDGGVHFSGRLEAEPAQAESPQAESPQEEQVLSIILDSPPAP
jgi:hypothetical protein